MAIDDVIASENATGADEWSRSEAKKVVSGRRRKQSQHRARSAGSEEELPRRPRHSDD